MHRLVISALAATAVAALAPARADACSMRFVDMFTRYDGAAIVATVEVVAIDKAGAVSFTTKSTLKGDDKVVLTGTQGGMCPPNYEVGEAAVAFADATGKVDWIEADSAPIRLGLDKWKAATTAAQKQALLKKLARSKDDVTKLHASERITADATAATAASWNASARTWKKPGTAKAAAARLRAVWPALHAAAGDAPGIDAFVDPFAKKTCGTSASKTTAKQAAARVRDTMGATDPAVVGSLAALDTLGDAALWLATCSAGFHELFVYIKQSDGAVVMAWIPPEG
jgi:hypothetical protein